MDAAIVSRERVCQAVARAMLDAPDLGREAAIEAAAQSLALPVEAVREVVGEQHEEAATC